jgi:predicted lipid-binding transport protein (Tim44 family)
MTIAELFQYLLFGVVLGLGSALQSLWRAQTGDTTVRQPAEETFEARLAAICRLERVDDLDQLLQSLTERYTSIVAAFTAGDLTGCVEDLSPEVAAAFAAAIAARDEAGEAPRGRVAVSSARIVGVRLDAEAASLEVAFTGLVAAGDGRGTVSASLDIWTFERPLARHHSHWRVVATDPIG